MFEAPPGECTIGEPTRPVKTYSVGTRDHGGWPAREPGEQAPRDRDYSAEHPSCGRIEASHWYCSACLLPMGPAEWRPTIASGARLAALDEARRKARIAVSHRPGPAEGAEV